MFFGRNLPGFTEFPSLSTPDAVVASPVGTYKDSGGLYKLTDFG